MASRRTERRRRTASVVVAIHPRVARRRPGWPSARARTLHARADERLRGAPGLLAARAGLPGAGRRARRVRHQAWASPTWSSCRSPSTRSAGPGATRSPRTTRRRSRFGTPDDFRYLVDALHQAGIGVIVDWVPAHFPAGRVGAGPVRRHRPVRARRPAPRRAPRLGHARLQLRPHRGPELPRRQRPVLAGGVPRRRPAGRRRRLDALPGLLPQAGQWVPNEFGGRENLEAVAFLQEVNATVYRRQPGVVTIAEESTAWPGVTRPTHLGGLGFGFKWNMGWMHDTLDYCQRDPIYRQLPPQRDDVLADLRLVARTSCCRSPTTRSCTARARCWRRCPADRWRTARRAAGAAGLHVGPPRQAAAVHGLGVRPGRASGPRSARWTGGLLDDPLPRRRARLVADLNGVYRDAARAVGAGHRPGRVLVDRRQRRGRQHAVVPPVRRAAVGRTGRRAGAVVGWWQRRPGR